MKHAIGWRVFAVAFLAAIAAAGAATLARQNSAALRIVVIEGEDAVNIIQQKTAVAPVVEVRDRNDLPVAGVPVTFAITSQNAAFAGGLQQVTLVTNAAGRAVAAGLNPLASGTVQIGVTATYQGQTAAITIAQTNVLTAAQAAQAGNAAGVGAGGGSGGGLSTAAVVGITGAASAAAVGALIAGGEEAGRGPTLSITTSPAGAGIREVTAFTFGVSGGSVSSPNYAWEFGDGATASGATAEHIYATEGSFQVRVRAADSDRNDSAVATIVVGSLTGTWLWTNTNVSCAPIPPATTCISVERLAISQQRSTLSGQWTLEFNYPGFTLPTSTVPLAGSVVSPRALSLSQLGECQRVFAGTIGADLNSLTGAYTAQAPQCSGFTSPRSWTRQ